MDGGHTLPVFSGAGEAALFLWLREERELGRKVHQTSADELVFVLSGLARVRGSWPSILL
jgi:hypothetical protein